MKGMTESRPTAHRLITCGVKMGKTENFWPENIITNNDKKRNIR